MPSQTTHLNPANLGLPARVGSLQIPSIDWNDFSGEVQEDSPYMAHIYWTIYYQYPPPLAPSVQQNVSTSVTILSKSWVKNKDRPGLLQHEYGHMLIGCLCALQFERWVNWELKKDPSLNFGTWCRMILAQCIKEFCVLERRYDDQTCHNLNKPAQKQWEAWIKEQILRHQRDFQLRNKAKQSKGSKKKQSKKRITQLGSGKSCPKSTLPRLGQQRRLFHKIAQSNN